MVYSMSNSFCYNCDSSEKCISAGFCKDTGNHVKEIKKNKVSDKLQKLFSIFNERNELYGADYLEFGEGAFHTFGKLTLETPSDFARFAPLFMKYIKLRRYIKNFKSGGHQDSLDDDIIYTAMLSELDENLRNKS